MTNYLNAGLQHFFKSTLILLFLSFLIFSCSVEKRIYQKGYHLVWKNKSHKFVVSKLNSTKINNNNLAAISPENKSELTTNLLSSSSANYPTPILNLGKEEEQFTFLNKEKNRKHGPGNFSTNIPIQKAEKFKKLSNHFLAIGDTVAPKLKQNKEFYINKLANNSIVFGVISIIFSIPNPFFFISYILAIIFGILAIKKGGEAIMLMKNDSELKDKYRKKSILGMKLGKFTLIFLNTLFFTAFIIGMGYFGYFLLFGVSLGIFPKYFIILAVLFLILLILIFFLLHNKIKKYYNSKIDF